MRIKFGPGITTTAPHYISTWEKLSGSALRRKNGTIRFQLGRTAIKPLQKGKPHTRSLYVSRLAYRCIPANQIFRDQCKWEVWDRSLGGSPKLLMCDVQSAASFYLSQIRYPYRPVHRPFKLNPFRGLLCLSRTYGSRPVCCSRSISLPMLYCVDHSFTHVLCPV